MTDSALKRFASLPAGADRSDWAAVLRDGATMVGMFVRLPTPELAASACDGSLAESAAAIVDELVRLGVGAMPASDWEGAFGTATLDGLRCDYTRLFAHPKHPVVQPCESLFLAQRDGGELPLLVVNNTAKDLDALYLRAGFARSGGGMIPGDHIGMELAFLAGLLDQVAGGAASAAHTAIELYENHGSRWWGPCFETVEQGAQTDAYRLISELGMLLLA